MATVTFDHVSKRPEHLELGPDAGDAAITIPANVDVVEFMGNEELIHAQAEGQEIIALVNSDRRVQTGETVDFWLSPDRLHVFDPESGVAVVA